MAVWSQQPTRISASSQGGLTMVAIVYSAPMERRTTNVIYGKNSHAAFAPSVLPRRRMSPWKDKATEHGRWWESTESRGCARCLRNFSKTASSETADALPRSQPGGFKKSSSSMSSPRCAPDARCTRILDADGLESGDLA